MAAALNNSTINLNHSYYTSIVSDSLTDLLWNARTSRETQLIQSGYKFSRSISTNVVYVTQTQRIDDIHGIGGNLLHTLISMEQ